MSTISPQHRSKPSWPWIPDFQQLDLGCLSQLVISDPVHPGHNRTNRSILNLCSAFCFVFSILPSSLKHFRLLPFPPLFLQNDLTSVLLSHILSLLTWTKAPSPPLTPHSVNLSTCLTLIHMTVWFPPPASPPPAPYSPYKLKCQCHTALLLRTSSELLCQS